MSWLTYFFSRPSIHKDAAEEVTVVTLVSLIPLLLLPLVSNLRNSLPLSWSAIFDAISAGQLFLYCLGLLGTLVWLASKDKDQRSQFPPRKYFIIILFITFSATITTYSSDPSMTKKLSNEVVYLSIAFYLIYILLYYVLTVFDRLPPPVPSESFEREADDLMQAFNRVRGDREND